jgi:uncharacterized protein (DUF433 family)
MSEVPAYSVVEAAAYLGIPAATIENWLSPQTGPLILAPTPKPLTLCFKNLIECHVLRALRVERRLSMARIRAAVLTLRRQWGTRYALADRELSTDDLCIFLEEGGHLYNVSRGGAQVFLEMVSPFLQRIERDPRSGSPTRFYPLVSSAASPRAVAAEPRDIVVDPTICFGRAVIRGSRISTAVVAGRHRAGDRVARLAKEYGRTQEEIKAAIRFEARRRAS